MIVWKLENLISNLQIRAQGSEGRVSTLATCDKLPVAAITASNIYQTKSMNLGDNISQMILK